MLIRIIVAALGVAMFVGCAHTTIESTPDQNGVATFSTRDTGFGFHSTAGGEWVKFGEGAERIQAGRAYAEYVRRSATWTNWTAAATGTSGSPQLQGLEQHLQRCEQGDVPACQAALKILCEDGDQKACERLNQFQPLPKSGGAT